MKKLDDLVFKNLHGLRDEDDQAKHKHDNKSLDNLSSDPQQQQQQMMYNYYNNNYATNMAPQQYGNQGSVNQGYMQNMQYQQGMNQANMGGMGNQNAYGMQQTSQFSQGNWSNAAQNQMQAGNRIPNILHPSQNPNFAQMNPMMQKQYVQMYQMAQLQMQQMKQAQNAFPNQGSFQNQQNTGNIQNTQQQYYQQSGAMGINPSYGNTAKQPSQGFNNFGSFNSNQNTNSQFDDDFADFQTSGNSNQNANNQFGSQRTPVDDFDDFQGASVTTAAGKGAGQQKFDEGFDDFQDASVTTAPQSTANEPKNWDILDDFVEKKAPTQPQVAQNPAPQQMYGNVQNLSAQQAQYLQNQAMYQNNMFAQQQHQQQNFGGVPAQQNTNANDNDDFEDFEEAKPSQVTKPKSPTKEDLMFGALESKAIKHMGLENIISHPTPTPVDDFGDFGAFGTTTTGTGTGNLTQPQNQDFGGDDFQDFEDAGPTKPQQPQGIVNNPPPLQEHKKLTIYDIDLAEFGITEATQGPHLTEPIKEQSLPEPPKQQHEDFGDFVEINEEKPSQASGFGAPQNQNELNFGYSNNETDKKAGFDADDWGFDNPAEPTTNVDHHDFGDFEEPQIAAPQTNQPATDGFDDFQEVAATNQKEIGKSWEHIDFPPVESQPKETHDAGDFGDFEEHVTAPVQVEQPQTQVKADEEFGDFDFPVTAATQKQDTLFEEFTSTPAPPTHTQNIATEEKQNAFDDFEEFSSPKVEEVKKVEEEHDDFGDFGEPEPQPQPQPQPQKEAEAEAELEQKMQIEEETAQSNPKQQVDKKLSVYDMDWGEFGIEENNQNAPPPMQFHFGGGFEDKSGQDEKKTPVSGGQALTDLYSLYGNTNVTTPVAATAEQGEDLFGEAQGAVIQEEKQEDQDDFDDFGEQPKPAAEIHENDGFDDFEAAPKKDDYNAFDFGNQDQNQNQEHGNDDFADFADFEAAPKESKPQNQAFEDPFFFGSQEPQQQHKEENLFGDFSSHANEVPTKVQEAHHDDDFGGFDHGSQGEAHHQDVFSDFQEPKQASPAEEHHEDDGFDDFADAGFDNKKQDEVATPVKSLSHIGGTGLDHDNSDYGSMPEVPHHQQLSAYNKPAETHEFDFKKKTSPTREDVHGKRVHDDFGSFNDADNADNQSQETPKPDHHHKDESIFHRADSSDYTPQNKKDESGENDDFGDFVGSKQDLPKEEAEAEHVPPSPPRESFKYTLESVLSEYGIKAGQENCPEKEEKNPLEEEIEKRIEEITQEFEEKLVKATLIRAAVKKDKFKLNSEMVEELAQELKSLQKYKEAILTEGQTKIIAEIKELNQTKARLIDEDELEEAVRYKDLVKNKEKEQIPKQKFEEFLSYYDNTERKDYRLALLEELRAANVPNNYINYFYIRFLGRAILPQKEVVVEEPPVENQPEETVEPAQAATAEVQEEQPAVIQENDEQKEILESSENKEEIKAEPEVEAEPEEQQPLEDEKEEAQAEKVEVDAEAEEQQPLEAEKEEVQVEKVETENQQVEEVVESEVKNEEQVDEKPQEEEAQKPEEDEFKFEEAEDKKDESQEAQNDPECQPEKENEDVQENEAPKQQEEEFGDFGESEEPTQKQDEEKVETPVEENQEEKEENTQPEVEEKQEEGEVKEEESKPQEDDDDGFGGFDEQPKPEAQDDFKFEEGEEKEEEIKPQEEAHDDGFGGFDEQPKPEAQGDFKFEAGEEKDEFEDFSKPEEAKEEPQEEAHDDGFGDFDNQPVEAKQPEAQDDFKFEEEHKEDDGDGFGDFGDQPQVAEKQEGNNDDFKFEEEHKEDDGDGFGDFDDQPQVEKKPENNHDDDFKFDDGEEKDEESKPQEEQPQEAEADDDGFGDFDNQPVEAKQPEVQDDFKFDDGEEKEDDGFGDFDDQQPKPEAAQKPEAQDDGFGDFDDQPVEVKQPEVVEEEEELKFEDIKTEEVPLTLEGLEEQKRRITQWSLIVKVMFAENINFNNNVRKVLKQIIYEIYKFNKMTTAILQEKNKDAARAILSSQKFENYITGIQILQAFYSELQTAFQFIELGNKWFNRYYKAIEDLTQKIDGLKNQIREEFNKEFPPQPISQENSKPAEWLGGIQKLDKEALRHICHLSLRLNDSQLTEYSGNYYFLPYLNFLLNIE